jgi:hypothetical protein
MRVADGRFFTLSARCGPSPSGLRSHSTVGHGKPPMRERQPRLGERSMKLRLLLLPVVGFLAFPAIDEGKVPLRATRIGSAFVLMIPMQRIDPGNRRPR